MAFCALVGFCTECCVFSVLEVGCSEDSVTLICCTGLAAGTCKLVQYSYKLLQDGQIAVSY